MTTFSVKQSGPFYVVYDAETGITVKEDCSSAHEAALYVATEKAGDVAGLAKHMLDKHGSEHLFTACMGDEATAEYDTDTRAAVCARVHHEATGKWPTEKEMKEMDATEKASSEPGDYLIVEDREKPTTWHLQVRKNGKIDHGLMGGAWAALHEGYRGNKYEGPNKQEAIGKLRKMYEAEKMPVPGESEAKKEAKPNIFEQLLTALKGDAGERNNGHGMKEPQPVEKEGRRNSSTDEGRLQKIHDLSVENGARCMVMKDAKGASRWVLISTNAYEDRDGEIVSRKAQKADVARMTATKQYGPLRLWHLGYPDVEKKEAGPGVDIGDCDYSQMFGKFRVESGTFRNERVAAAIKERADQWGTSVGFFHSPDDPDRDGVYHEMYTFERSILPKSKASNALTPIATVIKEISDMTTKQEKEKQLADLLGDKELADQVLKQVDAAEKQAQERGLTYKQANDEPAEVEVKSGDGKDKEPDEDDMDGMDEATAKAYKAMLPHIVKTIHALTKASNMEDAAAREAKAAKKEAKAAKKEKAKAKRKELEGKITALEATVKELTGDLPRGLAGGFRASQSETTILNASALKEAPTQPDPLGNFLNGLGMFKQ